MGTFVWQWPQIAWAALAGINILFGVMLDGQPKSGTHRFSVVLVATAFSAALLYFGGFFTEVRP